MLVRKAIFISTTIILGLSQLSACDSLNTRQRNTTIGAGVGGIAGAALGGNMLSTIGGTAAGGLIGNQIQK